MLNNTGNQEASNSRNFQLMFIPAGLSGGGLLSWVTITRNTPPSHMNWWAISLDFVIDKTVKPQPQTGRVQELQHSANPWGCAGGRKSRRNQNRDR